MEYTYFFRKLLGFITILIVVLTTSYFVIYNFYKKRFSEIKLHKHNLIIGDSNLRWSLNDSILSSYTNFAHGGETTLFSYTKLKIISKHNKIDTLILGFSPHNYISNEWWNDSGYSTVENRMASFFFNYTLEDHKNMIYEVTRNYFLGLSNIGKTAIQGEYTSEHAYKRFGSYEPVPGKSNKESNKYDNVKKYTEIEYLYLNKIIELCKKQNIHLILLQPPKDTGNPFYKNYNSGLFYERYHKNYNNIDFLNFSKLPVSQNYFWDIMHLNKSGSIYFSQFLAKNKVHKLLHSNFNEKIKSKHEEK